MLHYSQRMETALARMKQTEMVTTEVITSFAYVCSMIIPFSLGIYFVTKGQITLGTFMMISQLANNFINPKLNARASDDSDPAYIHRLAELILSGNNNIIVENDDHIIPMFLRMGVDIADARRYIGGGCQDVFLNRLTAKYTGKDIYVGPIEATAVGNIVCQMRKANEFPDLIEARKCIAKSFDVHKTEIIEGRFWEYAND